MTDVLWVIVGIIIGSFSGILTISLLTSGKTEDLYTEISNLSNEVQDLRVQRELLKGEIERLNNQEGNQHQERNDTTDPKIRGNSNGI